MKYCALSIIVCFVLIGQIVSARHSNLHEWNQYKRAHGKVYSTQEEDAQRFSLFLVAKEKIRQHNANENASYKLGLNQFSDWTRDELDRYKSRSATQHYNQPAESSRQHPFLRSILDEPSPIPSEVDWRKVAGRVTEVKDQHRRLRCDSDYAFATAGVLEGQLLVRQPNRTELVSLSAQQPLECTWLNFGCDGGSTNAALDDVAKLGGIETEQDYPYVGLAPPSSECSISRDKFALSISGSLMLPRADEKALRKTVATFGPVAIAMQTGDLFQAYKSGIYNDKTCDQSVDKWMLLVGFGTDPNHGDYWILKNSWGKSWGEDGYMRIKRGICAITLTSTIPTFD